VGLYIRLKFTQTHSIPFKFIYKLVSYATFFSICL